MTYLIRITILLIVALSINSYSTTFKTSAKPSINFSVVKECSQDLCSFYRVIDNQREELVTVSNDRLSDIKKLDDDLYYFHFSCGNPCGYGHYVTADEVFITEDNEILVDIQRKCIIYADWNEQKIFSYNLKKSAMQANLVYNFSSDPEYIYGNEDVKELLSLGALHELFKEDAFIDNKGTLHLYLLGKEQDTLKLKINNACETTNEL